MRVLVTGASGFVGGHLCQALIDTGHEVTAALRRGPIDDLPPEVLQVNVGDMGAQTEWRDALNGVEGVMHLAARTHVMDETATDAEALYRQINVDATARLAEQAAGAGVKRFVYLSSVKAGAENSAPGKPLTVDDPPVPEDAYGRTKRDGEAALWRATEASAMEGVVIRPPLVYGPGAKGNLITLFKAVNLGLPMPLGSVGNLRSVVYVGNLVDAMLTALQAPAAAGRSFYVCDGDDVSSTELIRRIGTALNRPARLIPFPTTLLFLAGRLTGKTEVMTRIAGSLQIDGAAIRQALDWSPPFSMKEGLEQTAAWYKSRGDG